MCVYADVQMPISSLINIGQLTGHLHICTSKASAHLHICTFAHLHI
jgi:hypothetical protein